MELPIVVHATAEPSRKVGGQALLHEVSPLPSSSPGQGEADLQPAEWRGGWNGGHQRGQAGGAQAGEGTPPGTAANSPAACPEPPV